MKKKQMVTAIATALVMMLGFAGSVCADSDSTSGSGSSASAQLEFLIDIESFVYFQIGSVGAVDTLELLDTGGGLSYTNNINVVLAGNIANVSIAADTPSISDGSGNSIPSTDISVADGGVINAPDFGFSAVSGTGTSYNLTDTWAYTYNVDTASPPPAGAYTGTATYTVTIP